MCLICRVNEYDKGLNVLILLYCWNGLYMDLDSGRHSKHPKQPNPYSESSSQCSLAINFVLPCCEADFGYKCHIDLIMHSSTGLFWLKMMVRETSKHSNW